MKESFLQCVQSLLLSIGSKPEQFPNYIHFSTRQVFYTQMTVIVPSSRWLHSSKISTLVGKRSLCKHHASVWGRDAELTAWLKRFFHQLWMAPSLPPLQADLYSAHSKLILAPQTCEPPTTPQAGSVSAAPRAASRPTPALHEHSSLVSYCVLKRRQEKQAEKGPRACLWGRWPSEMQTETRSAVIHHVQTAA